MAYYYRYTDGEGRPLAACPACGGDLTADGGIDLVLSVGGRVFEVPSCLDAEGNLEDTEDGAVANGYHAGTNCGHCGELLIDLDGVHEDTEES